LVLVHELVQRYLIGCRQATKPKSHQQRLIILLLLVAVRVVVRTFKVVKAVAAALVGFVLL
jgi:hypothetical protein